MVWFQWRPNNNTTHTWFCMPVSIGTLMHSIVFLYCLGYRHCLCGISGMNIGRPLKGNKLNVDALSGINNDLQNKLLIVAEGIKHFYDDGQSFLNIICCALFAVVRWNTWPKLLFTWKKLHIQFWMMAFKRIRGVSYILAIQIIGNIDIKCGCWYNATEALVFNKLPNEKHFRIGQFQQSASLR